MRANVGRTSLTCFTHVREDEKASGTYRVQLDTPTATSHLCSPVFVCRPISAMTRLSRPQSIGSVYVREEESVAHVRALVWIFVPLPAMSLLGEPSLRSSTAFY